MATTTAEKNGSAPAAPQEPQAALTINRIVTGTLHIPIVGTAPLIVHRFSEKAKRQMLDAQQGRKSPKTNRDPEEDYVASFYRFDDGRYGFPAVGFKASTVSAARFFGKDVRMTDLRQCLFVDGELSIRDNQKLVEITGDPLMREDVVRLGISGTDLRYRPVFNEWRVTLRIKYVKSMLSADSLLSLVDAAGMGVGVGEWRPERKGDFGTFSVDESREVVSVG